LAKSLSKHQADTNRSTAENWASFSSHRRQVTDLIVGCRFRQNSRLAVLGAGNCNDLDLKRLTASFASVDLFDLDAKALARGVRAQSMEQHPRLFMRGDVDFTGILPKLTTLRQKSARQANLEDLVRLAGRIPSLGNKAGYDVVASTCVLTQAIWSAVIAVGESHPLLPYIVLAMRNTHFRLLFDLAAPSGRVVFISDLVSSDSCPELLGHVKDDLRPLMEAVISNRNFFTGLNPYAIMEMVGETEYDLCLHSPWLWQISSQRAALVYALTFRYKRQKSR
jgi:hypothetical protein